MSHHYQSLIDLYPDWPHTPVLVSLDPSGRYNASSFFCPRIRCCVVVYRRDFEPLTPHDKHQLTKEKLEWSSDILDLASNFTEDSVEWFWTDAKWRIRNANFVRPGSTLPGSLWGWIQEESIRARDLGFHMDRASCSSIQELIKKTGEPK